MGALQWRKFHLSTSKLQGNDRNWQDNRLFLYTIVNNKQGFDITTNPTWQQTYYDKLINYIAGDFFTLARFNDMYARYRNTYKNDTNVLSLHSNEVYNNFGGTHLFAEYIDFMINSVESNPLS